MRRHGDQHEKAQGMPVLSGIRFRGEITRPYVDKSKRVLMRTNASERIDEEIVSVDCLAHCLTRVHGCNCDVQRVPQGCDPPDFWMTVDGERFAVEVTSIVTNEGYRAICKTLKDAIKTAMMECPGTSGTYALVVSGHPALPKKKGWHDLVSRALCFASATRDVPCTEKQYLLQDGRNRLTIQKLSNQRTTVGLVGMDGAKREGEVVDELRKLMHDKVVKKREKLENKAVLAECSRIILVLYDAYGYGDIEDAQKALLQVEGHDWFHSVFWAASFTDRANELSPANPGRLGDFLYSGDGRWWQRPWAASACSLDCSGTPQTG